MFGNSSVADNGGGMSASGNLSGGGSKIRSQVERRKRASRIGERWVLLKIPRCDIDGFARLGEERE